MSTVEQRVQGRLTCSESKRSIESTSREFSHAHKNFDSIHRMARIEL
jgi:hypothetical protein